MNTLWIVFGWLAFVLNVWGNLALTTKGVRGWIIRIACNLCWMPYGIYTAAWALLANHLLFVGINCYGWWRWHDDERKLTALIDAPGETPPMDAVERARRIAFAQGFAAGQRSKAA